jgi:hypothetical protein
LPPECPLPVQLKQMGCTFFWNSQEKSSDSIRLRLLPTKQGNGSSAKPTQCQAFTIYSNILMGLLTVLPSISTWDSGQSLLTNLHNACAQSSYLGESTVTSSHLPMD